MFFCEYCEIFKNTYVEEHMRTTASGSKFLSTPFLTNVKIVVIITLKTLAIFRIESIPNKKAQKLFLEPENSCSYHIFSSETIIYKKTPPEIPLCLPREDTNNDFRTIWYLHKTSLSSHSEVFLGKGVLKICSKFTGEHPC